MERRLSAILAADIAGYSASMGAHEARTVRDLKGHQAVVLPMVGEFAGRIIDTAGDGILAEFASVINAVKCALAIQTRTAQRNAAIEPQRRMQFRVGINIGDVVYDDVPHLWRRHRHRCPAGEHRRGRRDLYLKQGLPTRSADESIFTARTWGSSSSEKHCASGPCVSGALG